MYSDSYVSMECLQINKKKNPNKLTKNLMINKSY